MFRAIIVALALAAGALAAALPADAAADVYADYLQKSGLSRQTDLFEAVITREIANGEQRFGRLDPQKRELLRRAASQSYAADRLRDALRSRLSQTLSVDDATRALGWLDSALGARITRLEESASTAMAQMTQADDVVARAFSSLSPERKALLERMMVAVDASATVTNIAVNQVIGVARGFAALSGKSQADIDSEIGSRMSLLRAQIRGAMEPSLVAFAAVTYAALSDEEIRQYVSFLESETGRRVSTVVNAALDNVLTAAAVDFGGRIARDVASEAAKLNRT
jgi:hypothetical protein